MNKALAILAALASFGAAAATTHDYSHCDPLCLDYRQIGGEYFVLAVDSNGRFLGLSEAGQIGALMSGQDPAVARDGHVHSFGVPLERGIRLLGPDYAGSCGGDFEVHVSRETSVVDTETHRIIYTTTTVRCGGASGTIVYVETTKIVIPK